MHRADVGRKAMLEREELKRSAILRNGMMRREEVWPRDKPLPKWDLNAAIAHLQNKAKKDPGKKCGVYVREAIEAGGIRMNRALNSTEDGSAFGFGPILRDTGFRTVAPGEKPQRGDVAIFQPVKGHPNGHIAMFDGNIWISDFRQTDVYGGSGYRKGPEPYVLYRRP